MLYILEARSIIGYRLDNCQKICSLEFRSYLDEDDHFSYYEENPRYILKARNNIVILILFEKLIIYTLFASTLYAISTYFYTF